MRREGEDVFHFVMSCSLGASLPSVCGKALGGAFDVQPVEFPTAPPPNHSSAWKAEPAVKALCSGSLPCSCWGSPRQDAFFVCPMSLSAQEGQPVHPYCAGVSQGLYSLFRVRLGC